MLELKTGQELLTRYVIDKVLGMGGYGAVWKAFDKQLNRNVALKRLLKHGTTADDGALKDMLEEAKKNALVVHSNVAQVYDIIQVEDEYLIVMEFIDGDSLHAYLRRLALTGQNVPLEQAVDWLHEILEGVAYAHGQRICHRDLSPMNILLSSGGVPKISDFGIARIIPARDDAAPASPGSPHGGTGNPDFMAPEQARGEGADFLSDLFMVGICGYLLLSGRHPFAHPSGLFSVSELLKDESYQPPHPVPPASLGITEQRRYREYAAIVMRLLGRDRTSRYQDAQEAIDAIDRVIPSVDCPSCGEHVPEQYRFCGHCGAALVTTPSSPLPAQSAAVPKAGSGEELDNEGFQLARAKRWPQAIEAYRRAIEIDPAYRKAYWNLGFAYNRVGNYTEALDILSKGLALPPSPPRDYRAGMLYERSIARASLKLYDEALADVTESLRLNPDSVRSLYFRARVNLLMGNLDAAVGDAREVLRLNPDHSAALRMIDQVTKGRVLRRG
jgi:serine/threonine-protein kinase